MRYDEKDFEKSGVKSFVMYIWNSHIKHNIVVNSNDLSKSTLRSKKTYISKYDKKWFVKVALCCCMYSDSHWKPSHQLGLMEWKVQHLSWQERSLNETPKYIHYNVCFILELFGEHFYCRYCLAILGVRCAMKLIRRIKITGLILGLGPANERWRYFVTTSLIGWVQI